MYDIETGVINYYDPENCEFLHLIDLEGIPLENTDAK